MLNFSSNRQAFVFSKRGDKMSILDLPELHYLETEDDYIRKMLMYSKLDGMVIVIDWDKREITSKRFADE